MVKYLVNNGIDLNFKNNLGETTLIQLACNPLSFNVSKYLIENGANIHIKNNDGINALMNASYTGNLELVKLLIKNGADVNAKDKKGWNALIYTLHVAGTNIPKVEIIAILLNNGIKTVNPNLDDIYIILTSEEKNYLEILLRKSKIEKIIRNIK
jgi:hypothetical protein